MPIYKVDTLYVLSPMFLSNRHPSLLGAFFVVLPQGYKTPTHLVK